MAQQKYTDGSGVAEIWANIKNYIASQLLGYSQTGHTHSASDITSGLATVATSGSYEDLSNKPTIPTVNNATLKIQKNGTDVATFTANASSNVTANISVPTKVSQLTNDSGFLTSHQSLSNYVTSSNLSTALSDKVDRIDHGYKQITGNGTYSWCKLATITIKSGYINNPISFEIDGRDRERSILQVLFANVSNNDPSLTSFKSDLDTNFYIKKVATSTWELYGNYSEAWGSFTLYRVTSSINSNSVAIDTTLSNLSSAPSGTTRVSLNISVPTKTSDLTNDSGFLTLGSLSANSIPFYNSYPRCKYLGTSITDAQNTAIKNRTYDDLFVGDYWTINDVNWRIVAIDYYYNVGDTNFDKGNIIVMPDTVLYSAQMNKANTTLSSYAGSLMRTQNLNNARTLAQNAFGSHLANHRILLTSTVGNNMGIPTNQAWYDSNGVELPNEIQIYGTRVWGSGSTSSTSGSFDVGSQKQQFPLLALAPQFVNIRQSYWLQDISSKTTSNSYFARVGNFGFADQAGASNSSGVRPAVTLSYI